MYILHCDKCGKMYKAKKLNNKYVTDFGDVIDKCFCGENVTAITSEDWIANLVFTVKGK